MGVMYATKDIPSCDLEMGWMAIILLVPIASALLSLILTPLILIKRKKKNKKGKGPNENKIL